MNFKSSFNYALRKFCSLAEDCTPMLSVEFNGVFSQCSHYIHVLVCNPMLRQNWVYKCGIGIYFKPVWFLVYICL